MEDITQPSESKMKKIFREIWYFLSSRIFLRNLGLMLLALLLLVLFVHFGMKGYTNHGYSMQVPSFLNMTVEQAMKKAKNNNLKVVINDSIWTNEQRPGIIFNQSPAALSHVKKKRSIYLTITKAQADEKTLPSLVGSDNYDYYERRLKQMGIGLKVRDTKFNNKLEANTILHLYVDGKRYSLEDTKRGIKVPQGSEIEAVVTTRGVGSVPIPNLKCKTLAEAEFLIENTRLAVGSIIRDGSLQPGEEGYVWMQSPRFIDGNTVKVGTPVDIQITKFRPSTCR